MIIINTRKIILTGLFASIGIVLPQIFHLFGGPALGRILLPMHLPVFIGAMLLGPVSGAIIALISIGVGVMVGMPSLLIASYMVFELLVYAVVSGLLYKNFKINVFASYFIAKILGMAVAILFIQLYINLFGLDFSNPLGTLAMFVIGIPGIIIQAIIIPTTVIILKKVVDDYARLS